jgi:hypothetical protein
LGRFCRNHPCVARYSLTNEVRPKGRNLSGSPWLNLIEAMKDADDLRPLSYDLHRCGQGRVEDGLGGHAYIMEHYAKVVPSGGTFRALGESCWQTDGILNWAYTIRELRMNDWAYGSCWAWINYWPNFLEGMNHDKHAWKPQNAPDRTNGINGWDSPLVRFFRKSTHPYLLIDHEIRKMHKHASRREVGDGSLTWPRVTSSYTPGSDVVREIELFNGGLTDGDFRLVWEARFDKADGPVLAAGATGAVRIKAGFHASQKIKFTLPSETLDADRRIYIVMRSEKDGSPVFTEDRIWVKVLSKKNAVSGVAFAGIDRDTHGAYRKKYGRNGYKIAGDRNDSMPGFVKLKWKHEPKLHIWSDDSDAAGALPVFSNDESVQDKRVWACWSEHGQMAFSLDVGPKPQVVSLYFTDGGKGNRSVSVEVAAGKGRVEKRLKKGFRDAYIRFKIRGRAEIRITDHGSPMLSALFFDD